MKRYVHEKIRYIQSTPDDEHVLVIPGAKNERIEAERSRIYSIRSPLLSRTSRYRALLNLRAIEEVLEREQPDLIESGDPYQVAWKAILSGSALRIPVVGFYHSHFPEAYLRRINSRTCLNKGDGGSASFLFRPSMRLRSASVANFPAGSLKKVSILS